MDHVLIDDLKEEYDELSADGFRVLAHGLPGPGAQSRPTRRTTSAT